MYIIRKELVGKNQTNKIRFVQMMHIHSICSCMLKVNFANSHDDYIL